jgi:hypothetical protein
VRQVFFFAAALLLLAWWRTAIRAFAFAPRA